MSINVNLRSYLVVVLDGLRRPVGRPGLALMIVLIATAPAILFFDPIGYPLYRGHITRDPLDIYALFSDDVAYVSASLTWQRALSNLFVPHNTHVVPAWRLVTWGLVTWAGSLERVPEVFAVASYSILVAVMLMTARLVARETGQTSLGLIAMVLVGTTSLMLTPATWYSAGQPLWAGFGILATLWYAQSYRRSGRVAALVLGGISAPLAGWFWTIGHMAGPVAAVYLWLDGRRRCRFAAAAPLAATTIAVALSLALAGRRIDSTISFHGRSVRDAASPVQGLLYTGQAIPENLIFANLGLTVHTTSAQGAVLTLGIAILWSRRWWSRVFSKRTAQEPGPASEPPRIGHAPRRGRAQNRESERPGKAVIDQSRRPPGDSMNSTRELGGLACAGALLVVGSYVFEWTFRGYMDYQFLRTINLRFIVPWYDAIPQLGAVVFAALWWAGSRAAAASPLLPRSAQPLTWLESLGIGVLIVVLIVLNRPRVDDLIRKSAAPLLAVERERFPIPRLQTERANYLLLSQAERQRKLLRRLDRCQETARRMGLGKDAIRSAFGHPFIPGSVSRVRPSQYELYDAVAVLDLPERGRPADPAVVRAALAEFFTEDREPRPSWIPSEIPWPPQAELPGAE